MKKSIFLLLSIALAASLAMAQPADHAQWLGVWQGELDGQPSVVLTLADDNGELGGTVVLNIIRKENGQARVVAMEPHILMSSHVEGETLAFQIKKLEGELANFTVKLTAANKAEIHCSNCGSDAPTVDIARAR
jgi:hypothetical protein